jgi:succinate dehydrogenase / fumarate reductase cytochrome b subunit
MNPLARLFGSTIGKKAVMAVTGFILVGYLVLHMLGNLKAFQGSEALDAYAHHLRVLGEPILGNGQALWLVRLVLLASVGLHIWSAAALTVRNRTARPVGYKKFASETSTFASRTMVWGGVIIALYVIYHILHFTTGQAHADFRPGAVYANVVHAFRSWPVAGVYIFTNLVVGLHLYHGFWSALRTLGANNPQFEGLRRGAAAAAALVITAGFISVPAAVLAGFIR